MAKILNLNTDKNKTLSHGHRVEMLMKTLIENGRTNTLAGHGSELEKALGTEACKKLADYLENRVESTQQQIGVIC